MKFSRLLAVGAAALAAFTVVQVEAGARTPPHAPGQIDPITGSSWTLEASGFGSVTLDECSGFGSRSEVVLHTSDGHGTARKIPGRLHATDITCTLPLPDSSDLYEWRRLAEQNQSSAFVEATFVLFDASLSPRQQWNLERAWISEYLQTADRVVVVLTHEGAERVQ